MNPIKKPLGLRSLRLSDEDWISAEAFAATLGGKGHSAGVRAAIELAQELLAGSSREADGPYGKALCPAPNRSWPPHAFRWNLQGEPQPGDWVQCEEVLPGVGVCCHTFIWHGREVFEKNVRRIKAERTAGDR